MGLLGNLRLAGLWDRVLGGVYGVGPCQFRFRGQGLGSGSFGDLAWRVDSPLELIGQVLGEFLTSGCFFLGETLNP